jgi:hypothetical protein
MNIALPCVIESPAIDLALRDHQTHSASHGPFWFGSNLPSPSTAPPYCCREVGTRARHFARVANEGPKCLAQCLGRPSLDKNGHRNQTQTCPNHRPAENPSPALAASAFTLRSQFAAVSFVSWHWSHFLPTGISGAEASANAPPPLRLVLAAKYTGLIGMDP